MKGKKRFINKNHFCYLRNFNFWGFVYVLKKTLSSLVCSYNTDECFGKESLKRKRKGEKKDQGSQGWYYTPVILPHRRLRQETTVQASLGLAVSQKSKTKWTKHFTVYGQIPNILNFFGLFPIHTNTNSLLRFLQA